jgi:hypothetical protein
MKAVPVNPAVGTHIATAKGDAYVEYLRTDSRGRVINTQNALVKGRYAEETEHARRPHRPLRRRAPERPFYFRSARR